MTEKSVQISDMSYYSLALSTAIMDRIGADAPRKVWTPRDFLDLGSRDAVDKTLQRLTTKKTLRRLDRGLYDQPGFNKLTQKPNPPDPRSVIEAIGRRDQARMLVDGMTAANDVGLTDAVPAKIMVHTDARLRPIQLGNVTITFRPTSPSKLFWAGRPAMRIVQALHWMRDLLNREGEADQMRRKLAKLVEDPTTGPLLKADLSQGLTTLPTWMRMFLKPLLEDKMNSRVDAGDHSSRDHHHDRVRQISAKAGCSTRDKRKITPAVRTAKP